MILQPVYRITTFVPPTHLEVVLDAVCAQTSLTYGPYDRSAWWFEAGTEQFRPLPGSNPTIGVAGQTQRVPTVRLEFAIRREQVLLDSVLGALIAAHPWQEAAVFIDESIAKISNPQTSEAASD